MIDCLGETLIWRVQPDLQVGIVLSHTDPETGQQNLPGHTEQIQNEEKTVQILGTYTILLFLY